MNSALKHLQNVTLGWRDVCQRHSALRTYLIEFKPEEYFIPTSAQDKDSFIRRERALSSISRKLLQIAFPSNLTGGLRTQWVGVYFIISSCTGKNM
ncbi:hypothetical protein CEXT_355581 [Caerostris extrusa]|uniref:Maturase K n=1 Tax=Caerostris extrusa TaxID=172846 RepID=A0AAV4QF95_CAEEX|nr:hypothetical protein CEXT_355581 [Caerostris extrusa]